MTGRVAQIVNGRGFGFIREDGGGVEYFFHASGLAGVDFSTLHVGEPVTFEVAPSDRGPRACEVRPVRPQAARA